MTKTTVSIALKELAAFATVLVVLAICICLNYEVQTQPKFYPNLTAWTVMGISIGALLPFFSANAMIRLRIRWLHPFSWILAHLLCAIGMQALVGNTTEFRTLSVMNPFLFWALTVGFISSCLTLLVLDWVRKLIVKKPDPTREKKQFSLWDLLVWLGLSSIILAIVVNNFDAFGTVSIEIVKWVGYVALVYAALSACVFWPSQIWIQSVSPKWLSAATIVVTWLIASAILSCFAIFGTEEVGLAVCAILGSTIAAVVFSAWSVAMHVLCQADDASLELRWKWLGLLGRWTRRVGIAATILAVSYCSWWILVHFVFTGAENRDPEYLQRMPQLQKHIVEVWYPEGNREFELKDGELLVDFINRISSDGIEPQNNFMHAAVKVFGIHEIVEGASFLSMLQVPPDEIGHDRNLFNDWWNYRVGHEENGRKDWRQSDTVDWQDEQSRLDDFYQNSSLADLHHLATSVPWNSAEFPMLAEYCFAMKSQIGAIRKASFCQQLYSPIEQANGIVNRGIYPMYWSIELLMFDAMFQLGNGDFAKAVEDFESLARIAQLMESHPTVAFTPWGFGLRTHIKNLVLALIEDNRCDADQCRKIHRTALKMLRSGGQTPLHFTLESLICNRQEWKETNAGMNPWEFDQAINDDFLERLQTIAFPRIVDWSQIEEEWVKELRLCESILNSDRPASESLRALERYFETQDARFELAYGTTAQLMSFAQGPAAKGKWHWDTTSAWDSVLEIHDLKRSVAYSLIVSLESFQKIHGGFPNSLEELVPEFLEKIPNDTTYDTSFGYRLGTKQEGGGYWLYSTGSDKADDGGSHEKDYVFKDPSSPDPTTAFEFLTWWYGD